MKKLFLTNAIELMKVESQLKNHQTMHFHQVVLSEENKEKIKASVDLISKAIIILNEIE